MTKFEEMIQMLHIAGRTTDIEKLNIKDRDQRLIVYRKLGFTENSLDDPYWIIRKEAYIQLGWTEKAFEDQCSNIRYEAYWKLGFRKKALDDSQLVIRDEARSYFKIKELSEVELNSKLNILLLENM